MQIGFRPVGVGMTVAVLMGCGVPVELEKSFPVRVRSEAPGCASVAEVVSLSDEPMVARYAGAIQELELLSVVVAVVNPRAEPSSVTTSATGSVAFAETEQAPTSVIASFRDFPITAGVEQELPFDSAKAASAAALLVRPPQRAYVVAEACPDKTPAAFDLALTVRFRVTADVAGLGLGAREP